MPTWQSRTVDKKGRALASKLGVKLKAIALGKGMKDVEKQVFPYGVDVLWVGDDARLAPYTTLPHTKILVRLFDAEKPQVALMGATSVGRDLGPRVSSALHSGLTADCTSLEIGEYTDARAGRNTRICCTRFVRHSGEISWQLS